MCYVTTYCCFFPYSRTADSTYLLSAKADLSAVISRSAVKCCQSQTASIVAPGAHFIDQHEADLTRLRLLLNKRTGAAWLWRQDVRHVNMYQALKLDTSLSLWDSKQYLYMQSSMLHSMCYSLVL